MNNFTPKISVAALRAATDILGVTVKQTIATGVSF
jgi:hypothetical protein